MASEDRPPLARVPWLTHRRLFVFVIGWLAAFALLSLFVANPFASETSAAATPDYARVMFLHGLLIGCHPELCVRENLLKEGAVC